MPLLSLEPFVFPEQLLSAQRPDAGTWWVLHTKPRAEKALARELLAQQCGFFLPLYERRWRNRGRAFCSYVPLFPGYLFVIGREDDRLAALKTKLVVQCLPVPDQGQLWDDLVRLHRLITSGEPLLPEGQWQPGALVEIVGGPLAGLRGRVIRRNGRSRFVVEVAFLHSAASVEIEGWMIGPVDERQAVTSAR